MISQAINLEPLYPGATLCEKIQKVSAEGFKEVEFWGWDQLDLKEVRRTCEETGVKIRAFVELKNGHSVMWLIGRIYGLGSEKYCSGKRTGLCTLILFPDQFYFQWLCRFQKTVQPGCDDCKCCCNIDHVSADIRRTSYDSSSGAAYE